MDNEKGYRANTENFTKIIEECYEVLWQYIKIQMK